MSDTLVETVDPRQLLTGDMLEIVPALVLAGKGGDYINPSSIQAYFGANITYLGSFESANLYGVAHMLKVETQIHPDLLPREMFLPDTILRKPLTFDVGDEVEIIPGSPLYSPISSNSPLYYCPNSVHRDGGIFVDKLGGDTLTNKDFFRINSCGISRVGKPSASDRHYTLNCCLRKAKPFIALGAIVHFTSKAEVIHVDEAAGLIDIKFEDCPHAMSVTVRKDQVKRNHSVTRS